MTSARRAICRDCLTVDQARDARCLHCGSPRVAAHPELADLSIAHVDCDAFFAAVEKRDNPALRDKPVIVGGGVRGVVSTACYIARIHGVRSAMPMFKALKACPDAVVVKPHFERYVEASRIIKGMMLELTPLVQPISIDEAFLDLSGTERAHGGAFPALTLARFAARVEREVGITVSVGLAPNKFLAKIASDREKPRGFSVIGREEAPTSLADEPITIMPGIGKQTEVRLARAGITRVRHLSQRPLPALVAAIGRDGERLARLARGEDARRVEPHREAKSVSAETTFNEDIASFAELEPILWRLCEKVSRRLKAGALAGRSVVLKLKDRNFRIVTRTHSGLPPTQLARRLYESARTLLRATREGPTYRLIGIGAGDLCEAELADLGDLASPEIRQEARIEAAIDRIRDRFGIDAVQTGLVFPSVSVDRPAPGGDRAAPSRPSARNPRNRGGAPG